MRFSVLVEDREVIASGALVFGPNDKRATFDLDGLIFVLQLNPGPGPLQLRFVSGGPKDLSIVIDGALPELGAAWTARGIGQAGDRRIDLDLMIYSLSTIADVNRQIGFTFTATPSAGQSGGPEFTRLG